MIKLALRPDEPGDDPLMSKDASARHWDEMLDLVSRDLELRRYTSNEQRDGLLAMKAFWGSALDRRLAQLANGHKPSKVRLPNPDGHPSILAAFREAFYHAVAV